MWPLWLPSGYIQFRGKGQTQAISFPKNSKWQSKYFFLTNMQVKWSVLHSVWTWTQEKRVLKRFPIFIHKSPTLYLSLSPRHKCHQQLVDSTSWSWIHKSSWSSLSLSLSSYSSSLQTENPKMPKCHFLWTDISERVIALLQFFWLKKSFLF